MYKFKYHKPTSLDESISLFKEKEFPKYLSGGMTLIPSMKQLLSSPTDLIDIQDIKELKGIYESENKIIIGALTTHNEVAHSSIIKKNIKGLSYLASKIADNAVRNSGDQDVSHIFGMDIDFYNIMSVLRGRFWGLEDQKIEDLLVTPTVTTPKHLLERMAATENIPDALDELSSTRYKDLIPETEDEVEAIADFEHAFEMNYYNAINAAFSKMFSFATVIGISKLIGYEVRNIGAIAFAVEQKIPVETTMSKLIVKEAE